MARRARNSPPGASNDGELEPGLSNAEQDFVRFDNDRYGEMDPDEIRDLVELEEAMANAYEGVEPSTDTRQADESEGAFEETSAWRSIGNSAAEHDDSRENESPSERTAKAVSELSGADVQSDSARMDIFSGDASRSKVGRPETRSRVTPDEVRANHPVGKGEPVRTRDWIAPGAGQPKPPGNDARKTDDRQVGSRHSPESERLQGQEALVGRNSGQSLSIRFLAGARNLTVLAIALSVGVVGFLAGRLPAPNGIPPSPRSAFEAEPVAPSLDLPLLVTPSALGPLPERQDSSFGVEGLPTAENAEADDLNSARKTPVHEDDTTTRIRIDLVPADGSRSRALSDQEREEWNAFLFPSGNPFDAEQESFLENEAVTTEPIQPAGSSDANVDADGTEPPRNIIERSIGQENEIRGEAVGSADAVETNEETRLQADVEIRFEHDEPAGDGGRRNETTLEDVNRRLDRIEEVVEGLSGQPVVAPHRFSSDRTIGMDQVGGWTDIRAGKGFGTNLASHGEAAKDSPYLVSSEPDPSTVEYLLLARPGQEVEGFGQVLEIVDYGGGSRMIVMEKGSVFLD